LVYFAKKSVCSKLKWFNLILYPENIGIDTKIILIPFIITEILMKTRFSVMAALICILRGLPKDARVASFRFLKSTPQWYRNSKKNFVWTAVHAYWSLPQEYSYSDHESRPQSMCHLWLCGSATYHVVADVTHHFRSLSMMLLMPNRNASALAGQG